MRIFVISLPQSVDRRERMHQQLSAQRLPFSFFDGINFHADRNRYFHHCDEARFLLNTGRTPSSGELGCFASHLMVWRTCRLLGEPVVVLEDDMEIASDFSAALPFAQRQIDQLGFIRLQRNGKRGGQIVVNQQSRQIRFCTRFPHGSGAYMISPSVANAFIEESAVFRAPVDVFIKRYWQHRQPLFTLSPSVARSGSASAHSTIPGRQRTFVSVSFAFRRWWQKREDFVSRLLFNLRWRWVQSRRKAVQVSGSPRLAPFKSDS